MCSTEEVQLATRVLALLMNMTALRREEYNLYLAESDVGKCIQERISLTFNLARHSHDQDYAIAVGQLRESGLRLFKNILGGLGGHVAVAVRLAELVLRDTGYFALQPDRVFLMLEEGMRIEGFWEGLLGGGGAEDLELRLAEMADTLQIRCFQQEFLEAEQVTLTE